jgi:ABC-type glycerol-3-phosphate transport system substrate-binding protein
VDVFRKYNLSSPRSPKSGDENASEELALGKKSLVDIEYSNRGILVDRASELLKNGTIQWGPQLSGPSGTIGNIHIWSFHLVRQEGTDAEVKERCAWEFIKFLLQPKYQLDIAEPLGSLPLRQDVWDQLKGKPEHLFEPHIEMLKTKPRVWSSHPLQVDVQYNKFGPRMSNILNGKDPDAEIEIYCKEIRDALKSFDIKEYM